NTGNGITLVDQQTITPGSNDAGGLILTAAGSAAGFTLSTFVNGVPHSGSVAPFGGHGPFALGFTPAGKILVAEEPSATLHQFADTDGQAYSAGAQVGTSFNNGNSSLLSIARDGDTLYLVEKALGAVVILDPTTGATTPIVDAGTLTKPNDILVNP